MTRRSKGVAFVLFLEKESAHNCTREVNSKQVSNTYSDSSLEAPISKPTLNVIMNDFI